MMVLEKIKANQTRRLTARPACKTQDCPSVTTSSSSAVPITAEDNGRRGRNGSLRQPSNDRLGKPASKKL